MDIHKKLEWTQQIGSGQIQKWADPIASMSLTNYKNLNWIHALKYKQKLLWTIYSIKV